MKSLKVDLDDEFIVLGTTKRSQGASMVLPPGGSTGGPRNRHDGDQWMYVVAGRGEAVVAGERVDLEPGTFLLIEAHEGHEIRNTGDEPLRTLNVYAPPQY